MLTFWLTLTTTQQTVIVTASLVAFLAGALPTIAECVTHLAEYLLAFLMCIVAAAWPSFARHSPALILALDKQRHDARQAASKEAKRPGEGAAA